MWSYLFKVNNKNVRKCYKICSNLTIRSVVLLFSLLTLLWTYFTPFSSLSIFDFEQENVRWVGFSRITEGMFAYFAVPIGEATDRFPDWEVLSFSCVMWPSAIKNQRYVRRVSIYSSFIGSQRRNYWVYHFRRCLDILKWRDHARCNPTYHQRCRINLQERTTMRSINTLQETICWTWSI